jgi:hypothetical protein
MRATKDGFARSMRDFAHPERRQGALIIIIYVKEIKKIRPSFNYGESATIKTGPV